MKKNENNQAQRLHLKFGDTIEQGCMIIMAIGLLASLFVEAAWEKIAIGGVCALVFMIPMVLRFLLKNKGINADKVCSVLKKRGISPVVDGNEIRWDSNGKECILRIRSECQVEIAREYDIPQVPAIIDGNEKAALETMKEVYLAKVSVRENNGNRRLAFSTESLCVSAREFSTYLPMCLEILDLAENRQREHIAEINNGQVDTKRRRIGFIHQDGNFR